ncbi:MAG: DASS family sodium-coupled anion symporter [Desulfotomaculum sp.]|nr:DASS family sodium-coupled anion symporter [Desulfotomaculum sp.]
MSHDYEEVKSSDEKTKKDLHDLRVLARNLLLFFGAIVAGLLVYAIPTPDGLSETGHMFLALLVTLLIMFLTEPIPLPLVMVFSGTALILLEIGDRALVWSGYAHPVVFFILGCLMIAVVAESVGLTDRLGKFFLKIAGTNVIRFSFIMCMGLGIASSVMHDIAATAIGIMLMLPLMKAAKIELGSRMGAFLTLSLPFACSAGGMGTLIGGGRNMVAAAFLDDITGGQYTISFIEWTIYCLPIAVVMVPVVWFSVYLVFRPDKDIHFKALTEEQQKPTPFNLKEIKALVLIGITFAFLLTGKLHGINSSVIVMLGSIACVLFRLIDWKTLNHKTEWAVCFLVFGGGIALGTAMGYSGAAAFLADVFFPFFEGRGWLVLFIAVGVFAGLITNMMANVAAAALILPIAIPLAILEGVDPTLIALGLGMFTSFAFLLVIGCPPNIVAYSFGYFKASQLTKTGLVVVPIAMSVLIVAAYIWWSIIGLI